MNTLYYGEELYHHGIKGQKWGIRNYQNKDGSLTPAGLKRYSDKDIYNAAKTWAKATGGKKQRDELDKRVSSRISKEDLARSKELRKKAKSFEFTDAEQDEMFNLIDDNKEHTKRYKQLEKKYDDYTAANDEYIAHNRKLAKSILGKYSDYSVKSMLNPWIEDNASQMVEKSIQRLADRD